LFEDPYNASLVTNTIYPDSSDTTSSGTDQVKMAYYLDGHPYTKTDQRGVEITYLYAIDRQLTRQAATTIPMGVDDSVKSIDIGYDGLGRVSNMSSCENNNGTGTVRNQLIYTYDSTHGRLIKTEQSHENAVSSSPAVQYAYDDDANSTTHVYTNGLRLKSVTYPNGRIIHQTYRTSGSIPDVLSRVEYFEADSSGSPGTDLLYYMYNGTSRFVQAAYLVPTIETRDFNIGGGGSYNFNALDRFGRRVEREWWQYTSAQFRDRFDYTLDYAGNRLTRNVGADLVNIAYTDNRDQVYAYDGLNRLKSFDEGTQSGGAISGTPTREQDWTLDQLGNWPGFVVKAAGNTTLDQTRYHNSVNEIDTNNDHTDGPGASITASGGTPNWADPKYDEAGNMTTMPRPSALTSTYLLKYDAWNRLVEVKSNSTTVVATYEYDGLDRRIQKVASDTYDYYYNENWQLLEERKNADTDPLNQFVWHPYYIDALAMRYYDDNTDGSSIADYYYLHDANFNVTAVANSSGVVLERYSYSPYGEVTVLDANFSLDSSGGDGLTDIGNTHFFTGRELDLETGLQLNRHRFYASLLGRWLTRDPIEYAGSELNLYVYVSSRPTNATDPGGLEECGTSDACTNTHTPPNCGEGVCRRTFICVTNKKEPEKCECVKNKGNHCRCTTRYQDDAERKRLGCPDRVYGTGDTRKDCQEDAKQTAPKKCRKFYAHCDWVK